MADQTKRDSIEKRKAALETERSSFVPHWKEISEFMQPRRGRFFITDVNRGDKRYKNIINSRATQAIKISRAGMLSGTMSPSRPWFALQTDNPDFMDSKEVRVWLDATADIINNTLNKSNLFNMVPVMLGELITFGTGAISQVDDDENVARFFTHTVGTYSIAQDENYRVNTFLREYLMSTTQLMGKFGKDAVSRSVNNAYDAGRYDQMWPVTSFVAPNDEYDGRKVSSKYKRFMSCYYESGSTEKEKFLKESGFDEFPVYVPRWDVTGEDTYGTDCPGMIALGDVKQLQLQERRKAQAIDKLVNPPLKGPASLRNVPVNSLPGGLTIYDQDLSKDGLTPIYQVDPRVQELLADVQAIEGRINEAFYVDLFFAISQMEGIQPRNQLELTQRNQERLLQLGPVLERLQSELLSPMIERTFNQLARKNFLPPPPDILQGQPLKVQFVSSLAMAQRSGQVGAIENLRLFVSELAQSGFPEAIDKVDADEAIDQVSLITGVPSKIIRSDEEAAQIRQQRAERAQQQAGQAQQQQLTEQLVQTTRR